MTDTVKIAISLPRALLLAADAAREQAGITRSEFFRAAVEDALRSKRDELDDAAYIRSYREQTEDDADAELVRGVGRAALRRVIWP